MTTLDAAPIAGLDPDGGLDDLEFLRDMVGSARVVGLGETCHYVREYTRLRHRMTRFLVERMGFDVVALESGFSEGLAVGRWVRDGRGDLDEVARTGLTYRFGRSADMRRFIAWMRGLVTFTGIDLPGDLASMLPALDSLDRYVAGADPAAGELVAGIRRYAEKYAGPHTLPAFAAYRALAASDRDELTLLLAELGVWFDTRRPYHLGRTGPAAYADARHELRLAALLDQALRAQHAAAGGSMTHAAVNVRDFAMAESVLRLRPDSRVVLLAANSHLQRVPVLLGGVVEVPVTGMYLSAELGGDYVAVAVTSRRGRVPARRRAPSDPRGVELVDVDLAEPAAGSVEALLPDALCVADVRPLRSTVDGPGRIRSLDSYLDTPVADAFDFVAGIPSVTPVSADER